MKILIDNGHGVDTPGKRSPDGRFREYSYCRKVAAEVCRRLREEGFDAERIVEESADIPLAERTRRVNSWCEQVGSVNVCLVSIHNNAAGNGSEWMSATGWEAWTSKGESRGDRLAESLYGAAERVLVGVRASGFTARIRRDMSDGDSDKEANFYILAKTKCAAVLTENFFQDCKADVEWLESAEGFDAVVELHCLGIKQYVLNHG